MIHNSTWEVSEINPKFYLLLIKCHRCSGKNI